MEARISQLERDMGEVRTSLARIESGMAKASDLSYLQGRIDTLPTTKFVAAAVGVATAVIALLTAILRLR